MASILLETRNLAKRFCKDPKLGLIYAIQDIFREIRCSSTIKDNLRRQEFWAVRDINIQLQAGEVVGIIGHNGAGKSTFINLVTGILQPSQGEVIWYTDRVVMVDIHGGLNSFQTGRENIYNKLSLHGVSHQAIEETIDSIIDDAGIRSFIDGAVGKYSTGMRIRLACAIYKKLKPDVFIIDEALGGGDIRFAQKFRIYLREYVENGGTILLISHDSHAIRSLCHRLILLNQGEVYATGNVEEVIRIYNELMEEKQEESTPNNHDNLQSSLGIDDKSSIDFDKTESIEIKKLEIIPLDQSQILPGSRVEFRVTFNSRIENRPIAISLALEKDGIHSIANIYSNLDEAHYWAKAGENIFSCIVNQLPLMPGHYKFKVGVIEARTYDILGLKGYHDQAFSFEVKAPKDKAIEFSRTRHNLFYIPVNWQ